MRLLKNSVLAFLFLFIHVIHSNAQSLFSYKNKLNQYATVGFGGGSSHYFGDLAPYGYFYYGLYTNVRWNGTLNYTKYITQQTGIRLSFSYARLLGDDYTYASHNLKHLYINYLRNLHFRNDVKEFSATGIFNFLPQYNKGAQGRNKFMPYGLLGIGLFGHNPQAKVEDPINPGKYRWTSLKQYNTSGQLSPSGTGPKPYKLVQPVMTVGLGFKIKLNEKWDFMAEAGLRITPFDYLDDVGSVDYPNPTTLSSDISKQLSNRGVEDIAARTGGDRVSDYQMILTNYLGATASSGTMPSNDAVNKIGYGTPFSKRGTNRPDSYILTQFTINYIIGNQVKCPDYR